MYGMRLDCAISQTLWMRGGDSVKCCKEIDDDWIDGDMWHDNHTTFGCSHGKLLVNYQCPHCGKRSERDFVEVMA